MTEAELAAAEQALGAGVRQLHEWAAQARQARATAREQMTQARSGIEKHTRNEAAAGAAIEAAQLGLETARVDLDEAARRLSELNRVPGLLTLALDRELTPDEGMALSGRCDVPTATVLAAACAGDEAPGRGNDVLAAVRTLQASPAADLEPTLDGDDVYAAFVLDPISRQQHDIPGVLLDLGARVVANQELLTERERRLFEEHLLGRLGESLRSRRLDAVELIRRTNEVLRPVTTSQGIRVRLKWALKDDVGPEVRTAADLLTRPLGSLLPAESGALQTSLSRLIEASRQEDPELGYVDHLTRALDYREWSRFVIEIHRPEAPGVWQPLTRRTPLSQGEQKVVGYLPLFAAAAAHFESLTAGAPHAPRFILLDDAFPKIDAATHPLLFGLLVRLDLDFVITSERLWGTHDTVPSLAIYETLRSPTEPGIAQLRFRWDGTRLERMA